MVDRRFYLGIDPGKLQDYCGLVALEQIRAGKAGDKPTYIAGLIERVPMGTRYTDIATHVREQILWREPFHEHTEVIVDRTGPGEGFLEMLWNENVPATGVFIHAGQNVTSEGGNYNVPKRDLVFAVAAALEQRRLRIAESLPHAAVLERELANFDYKISAEGADTYADWRSRDHDDLVLALACALWYAEEYGGPAVILIGESGA